MSQPVVIVHETWGIYLGESMGRGFWSKLNCIDEYAACVFEDADDAKEYIKSWNENNDIEQYSYVVVDIDPDKYASVSDLQKAGLSPFLGIMQRNFSIYLFETLKKDISKISVSSDIDNNNISIKNFLDIHNFISYSFYLEEIAAYLACKDEMKKTDVEIIENDWDAIIKIEQCIKNVMTNSVHSVSLTREKIDEIDDIISSRLNVLRNERSMATLITAPPLLTERVKGIVEQSPPLLKEKIDLISLEAAKHNLDVYIRHHDDYDIPIGGNPDIVAGNYDDGQGTLKLGFRPKGDHSKILTLRMDVYYCNEGGKFIASVDGKIGAEWISGDKDVFLGDLKRALDYWSSKEQNKFKDIPLSIENSVVADATVTAAQSSPSLS